MEPVLARKMWRTLEPYHSFVYFAPEARHLDYFASRAAGLGRVPAEVVAATFFNFALPLVRRSIPSAWDGLSPADTAAARVAAVDETLRRVIDVGAPELVEAAGLARRAAEACDPVGRVLFAGHLSLPWPEEPHLVLWHAITLLREYRGDGHIAALLEAGLDGCQALVMHAASGDVPQAFLQGTRGWTDVEWQAAVGWLHERGWLDDDGGMTEAGWAARDRYEERTDRLALRPWEAIGQDHADRLRSLVRPFSRAIVEAGLTF
ncbi:MAG TPA: hypothetical protein VHF47_01410 [Acidimicrobiales bacterium]|nr:hypothetical protein [Acidimicrobiales bacterium]